MSQKKLGYGLETEIKGHEADFKFYLKDHVSSFKCMITDCETDVEYWEYVSEEVKNICKLIDEL